MSAGASNWIIPYGCIFIFAAVLSAFLTSLARKISHRIGMLDEPGERKIHTEPMPLLGGVAVFTAFSAAILITSLLGVLLAGRVEWLLPFVVGFVRRKEELLGVLGGGFLMLALGMIDDRRDLSPPAKLAGQIVIGTITAVAGVRLKLFIPNVWFAGVITVLWIVTVTNAANFFDNMDGLCAGMGLIAAVSFGAVAGFNEQYLVCGLALAFAGALLGFLFFNFYPAKIFLGDSGSHFVGYMLAVLGILPTFYKAGEPTPLPVLIPLLVLALPLFDAAAVVLIRLRNGQPIYRGDTNHLSHRLAGLGISQTAVVVILYLLQLVLCLGAVLLRWTLPIAAGVVLIQCTLLLVLVSLLRYQAKK